MTRHGDDDPPEAAPPGVRAQDGYGRGVSPFRPDARRPLLRRLVPVSGRLPGYGGGTLRRDPLAGVTVAALALPAAMAYGELAGLSAVAGLYALLLPTVAYTVLGSSRQLIVGPDGSIAALVAAAVVPLAAEDPQRAASLAVLLGLRWRFRKFPGPLVVVAAAIVASAALDLAADGVAVVGEIPSGLPGIQLPGLDPGDALALLPAALAIFLVSYADEILIARSFAGHRGEHVGADTELGAMGAANLAAGISQGFPIGGSGSRTAVNDQMGARTQLSGLLAAVAIALVLLFLTAPMRYLPKATLGAVIVADGIVFVFARVKTPMRHRLEDAGVVELVGPDHLYPTVRAAVQAAANDREEPQ
jgi:MFS superfamily sulfate permease-like transporter